MARSGPSRRRYLLLGMFLVVLIVPAGALPLLLLGGRSEPAPSPEAAPDAASSPTPTTGATTGLGAVATAPAASDPAEPSRGHHGATPPAGASSAPPVPVHLILEAEAGSPAVSLMRSVVEPVDGASGDRAARFTGVPGRVRFHSVAVSSASTYRVTIWYVPGGAWSGTVQGTDGQVPITFAAGTGCCAQVVATVPVLVGGTITVRLTSGSGGYPAVDRIAVDSV